MNKKCLFLLTGLVFGIAGLNAQSNSLIDQFLDKKSATLDLTTYLVLTASKQAKDTIVPKEALKIAKGKAWIQETAKDGDDITADQFAYLLMNSFNLKGGLMYSLFPSPWYAVKEISFKKLFAIQKRTGDKLTPFEVLQTLNTLLESQETVK